MLGTQTSPILLFYLSIIKTAFVNTCRVRKLTLSAMLHTTGACISLKTCLNKTIVMIVGILGWKSGIKEITRFLL